MRRSIFALLSFLIACNGNGNGDGDGDDGDDAGADSGGDATADGDSITDGDVSTDGDDDTETDGSADGDVDGDDGDADLELPCLNYWDVEVDSVETPLCAALHDPEFLFNRSGPGLDEDARFIRLQEAWRWVNEWYAPWDSTDVDWDEVFDRYRPRLAEAESRYEQLHLLTNMYAELEDSHTFFYELEGDDSPALFASGHPFGFDVTEIDSELYVFYSYDPTVEPGDRVVTVNGLRGETLRALWMERLKLSESFSSESARQAHFEMSVLGLANDPLFIDSPYEAMLGIELERRDDGSRLLIGPDEAGDLYFSNPTVLAYFTDSSPVNLEYEPYDTGYWGGNRTSYIGHARYHDIAVLFFYDFTGDDDLERAIREVVALHTDAIGFIIDIRINTGGGPHNNTLTSFFIEDSLDYIRHRFPPDAENCGPPECPLTIEPDHEFRLRQPVAVLTGGLSISAADHFAYYMAQVPTARLFGQPTAGAFGNISVMESYDGTYGALVTWSVQSDMDGKPLQGQSVEPHEEVRFSLESIDAGVDPVFEAAVTWIESH